MSDDSLYVDWHLLHGCNHDCEYNHEPDDNMAERFLREELLLAAYRLLSLNRPEYIIHLYGGEPSIHPYFQELFKYLTTAGRNTYIVLDTNGLRNLDYYAELFKHVPKGRLCVNIDVHLKYMDLKQLLLLIAHVVEKNCFCRIILNHVPDQTEKSQDFCEKLTTFRQKIPFMVEIRFPLGGSAPWLPELGKRFSAIVQPHLQMPGWAVTARVPSTSPQPVQPVNSYACLGINSVHITSDGRCTQGLFADDQPFFPQIHENILLRPGMPIPPSFADRRAADAFLAASERRRVAQEINGGPVRHPLYIDLDESQKLRLRLKRLKPEATAGTTVCEAQPSIWTERSEDTLTIFARLADEDSRTIFLRWLKANVLGDSRYLLDSAYEAFVHPALCVTGAAVVPNDSSNRLIRQTQDVTPEAITALLPKVEWYGSALEFVLPAGTSALDVLLEVGDSLPEYLLYLGQHGQQTILYALPRELRKHRLPVPPRTVDGNPLVSIIVAATDDADTVKETLESALACRLPRYEVIVVLHADNVDTASVVDDYVRRAPWHVRPYRFEEDIYLSAAWDAGLDMAQGEYVCFLRTGDLLHSDMLASGVDALESDDADIGLFSEHTGSRYFINGSMALTRYLTSQVEIDTNRNRLYRASLLREHAVAFADLPADMEDQCFDLPAFAFARRLVCIPGALVTGCEREMAESCYVWQAFLVNLETFYNFCTAHDISLDKPEVRTWILRRFAEVRSAMQEDLRGVSLEVGLGDVLNERTINILTRTPYIVQSICDEFAPAWCKAKDITITKLPAPEPVRCLTYEGAATGFDSSYPLSIIITVEEKGSLICLERLAEEDSSLVECVIIDNACNEETAEALANYADLYPNFRLFRMEKKALLAQCRNAGLEQACGKGVMFIDSDAELLPDFVASASAALNREPGDVFVYGVDYEIPPAPQTECNATAKNMSVFFNSGVLLDTDGIVFRREYLARENLIFEVENLVSSATFTLQAVQNGKVILKTEVSCNISPTEELTEIYIYPGTLASLNKTYTLYPCLTDLAFWDSDGKENLLNAVKILQKYWMVAYTSGISDNMLPMEVDKQVERVNRIFSWVLLQQYISEMDTEIKNRLDKRLFDSVR